MTLERHHLSPERLWRPSIRIQNTLTDEIPEAEYFAVEVAACARVVQEGVVLSDSFEAPLVTRATGIALDHGDAERAVLHQISEGRLAWLSAPRPEEGVWILLHARFSELARRRGCFLALHL